MQSNASTQGGSSGAGGAPLVEQAKSAAADVAQQTQQKAGDLMNQARDQFGTQLERQKDGAAESATSLAQALRQTGGQLNSQNQAMVGQMVVRAADLAENVAGYIREHSVNDLVGEVEGFARREPVLFLGGAFALGFFASRFMKSSGSAGGNGGNGQRSNGASQDLSRYRYQGGVMAGRAPLAGDSGGPVETAGGSLWTGGGPPNDPRGQEIVMGGERDLAGSTAGSTADLGDETDEMDDAFASSSGAGAGRG